MTAIYRDEGDADDAVGRYLDMLSKTGRLDDSIVIVSADHGECFSHGVSVPSMDGISLKPTMEGALPGARPVFTMNLANARSPWYR